MSLYLPLFRALNEANVEYVVVGGLATVLHGYARFTADIDLVINLEKSQAERAVETISDYGLTPLLPVNPMQFADNTIRRSWIEDKNMLVFSFVMPDNPLLVLDLFVQEPIPYKELSQRAVLMDIEGVMVPVCAIKDLIDMKKKAARPKDLDDINHLQELLDDKHKKK